MKTTIYVPDIECDSCIKIIKRVLQKTEQVDSFKIGHDSVEVIHNEMIKPDDIVKTIKAKNFRASLYPFERKTFKERMKDVRENKQKYTIELKIFSYAATIFMMLVALQAISYFLFLKNIPNFLDIYSWWLLYFDISVATLAVGIWHVLAYRTKVTCMAGMMIGMTVGMQTGMMLGAVFGATNGFFVGAMVGMLLGSLVGAITGRCCGVMGVMEGIMAGLMGGTMGPMITVMMFSDHVLWFMPFYMILNVIVLWGLSYMLYEEVVEHKEVIRKPVDFVTLASVAIIVSVLLMIIMLYGPRSALLSF